MSRGRTENKIWQLITFSWHTLLWIVNETSDLIGQLDSREPIILLWCTHIINTVDIWNNTKLGRTTRYRERNTNDKESNGGGRGRGRGEGRGERSKCAVFLLTFLDFICAPIEFIWLLNQSKKWCLSTERYFEIFDCCIPFYSSVSSGCDLNMPWGYFTAAYGNS